VFPNPRPMTTWPGGKRSTARPDPVPRCAESDGPVPDPSRRQGLRPAPVPGSWTMANGPVSLEVGFDHEGQPRPTPHRRRSGVCRQPAPLLRPGECNRSSRGRVNVFAFVRSSSDVRPDRAELESVDADAAAASGLTPPRVPWVRSESSQWQQGDQPVSLAPADGIGWMSAAQDLS
jgi:hypothetical protein